MQKAKTVWLYIKNNQVVAKPPHVTHLGKGNQDEVVWLARDNGDYQIDFNKPTGSPFVPPTFRLGAKRIARSGPANKHSAIPFDYLVTELTSGLTLDPDVQVDA
jgi:hypothetical protein